MQTKIYASILKKQSKGRKQFAVLIDPDKAPTAAWLDSAAEAGVDLFLVGGSLLTNGSLENCIGSIRKKTKVPVLLFPGNALQVSNKADGILFLSVISGRNPEMLIGKHVVAAPLVRSAGLEVIPTGYILVESGKQTAVSYMSNTVPIPHDKADIAMCTAMAGEMLGFRMIYLEAGSGALQPVSETMIRKVKENISVPLIVGGGIRTAGQAAAACKAGADIIVVGNALEKDGRLMEQLAKEVHSF